MLFGEDDRQRGRLTLPAELWSRVGESPAYSEPAIGDVSVLAVQPGLPAAQTVIGSTFLCHLYLGIGTSLGGRLGLESAPLVPRPFSL